VHDRVAAELPLLLDDLARWTAMDSPSREPGLLDDLARDLAATLERYGAAVELVEREPGLHLHAVAQGVGSTRTALLCHHDTVFPSGTAAARPFAQDGARVHGPGVADMKGGLALAVHVARHVAEHPGRFGRVEVISVPDEEIRSGPFGTIERVAGFDAVLCLECGREDGSLVLARKGGAWLEVEAVGRAAHAGTEPERGRNPVLALAHEAIRIAALHDGAPGLSVQVTSLRGGRAANAIPDRARMQVDIRASHAADLERTLAQVSAWGRHDGVTIAERSLHHVPPLEPTADSERLARAASLLGGALGHPIGHASTGGVSDVCWVAWSGVPCLDGLGPVGGADHSPEEYVEVPSFAPRAGVVAGLLAEVEAQAATPG
jgi:glutamate carboxypeptidase